MNEKTKKALNRLHKKLALKQNECSFVEFLKKNPSILKYSSKAKAKRYFMSLASYSDDFNIVFSATYLDFLKEENEKENVLLKLVTKNKNEDFNKPIPIKS